MSETILNILKKNHVVLEAGLTFQEMDEIETLYGIRFPGSLRTLLTVALPVSPGFYNWRNRAQKNIMFLQNIIREPKRYIDEMPEEIYWCEDWGEEPWDRGTFQNEVRRRVRTAPQLIPVYSHRYIPMTAEKNPPVLSVHGGDVIYMGENLEEYFKVEFGEKSQNEIDLSQISPVPFWSDLM